MVFAVLVSTSLVLLWVGVPADPAAAGVWLRQRAGVVRFALSLVPFAGIAFLWFVGVARDRLGDLEDRFFATVLLGSGLLYIALTFAATSIAGGLLAAYAVAPERVVDSGVYALTRSITSTALTAFAMRMAGVFMVTQATMWLRTRLMPRAVCLATYGVALVLLLALPVTVWAALLFPGWVLAVSILILVTAGDGGRTLRGADGRAGVEDPSAHRADGVRALGGEGPQDGA